MSLSGITKAPKGLEQTNEFAEPKEPSPQTETDEELNIATTQSGQFGPRQRVRSRMLTERGKTFQHEKLKELLYEFDSCYEFWKTQTRLTKRVVISQAPHSVIQGNIDSLENKVSQLNSIYDAYRKLDAPDNEMRRKMDKSNEVSKRVILNAQAQIQGAEGEQLWPEVSSVFDSTASSFSLPVANHSKPCEQPEPPGKPGEAAVTFTATQAVLEIMAEQEHEQEQLDQLEAEAAASHKESVERLKAIEEKRRTLEHLEERKRLNASKAKLKVYTDTTQVQRHKVPQVTVQQQLSPPRAVITSAPDDTSNLVKVLAEAITANRLPIPEPNIFSGEPLKFNLWKTSFQTLIERKNIPVVEKIFFLQKYVGGAAKEAIEGYFLMDTEESYNAAWRLLNERYGDPFIIAKAYRDKLHAWPKLSPRESSELRKFVDFLRSCEAAVEHNVHLNVLNDAMENQTLTAKLPDWLSTGWNRSATQYQLCYGHFPNFSYFVTFLNQEATIACNPITSQSALRQCEQEQRCKPKNPSHSARTFATNSSKSAVTCHFCKKLGHCLNECCNFKEKSFDDRMQFIQRERICFSCLHPGHQSKFCSNKMFCDICSKRHPTCLHREQFREVGCNDEERSQSTEVQTDTEGIISHRVVQDGKQTQTSAIVPVYVSSSEDPTKELLVYALLDSQSDCSFILEQVADALKTPAIPVKLELSTMSSRGTTVNCKRLKDVQVRSIFSTHKITMSTVYSREFIPANRSQIPSRETAKAWPHLEHLAEHMAPLSDNVIGLLIGCNCLQALTPKEIVWGQENQPFAQKTDLGWSIIGHGGEPMQVKERGMKDGKRKQQEAQKESKRVFASTSFQLKKADQSLKQPVVNSPKRTTASKEASDRSHKGV